MSVHDQDQITLQVDTTDGKREVEAHYSTLGTSFGQGSLVRYTTNQNSADSQSVVNWSGYVFTTWNAVAAGGQESTILAFTSGLASGDWGTCTIPTVGEDSLRTAFASTYQQPIKKRRFFSRATLFTAERFEYEKTAFQLIKDELVEDSRYNEKFVAVLGGKVVDSDETMVTLARRAYRKYGYIPIYIDKVTNQLQKIENPSPEP